MIHQLVVWAIKVLVIAFVAILLVEGLLRVGQLGQESPLDKRIRENVERNRKDRAA